MILYMYEAGFWYEGPFEDKLFRLKEKAEAYKKAMEEEDIYDWYAVTEFEVVE